MGGFDQWAKLDESVGRTPPGRGGPEYIINIAQGPVQSGLASGKVRL